RRPAGSPRQSRREYYGVAKSDAGHAEWEDRSVTRFIPLHENVTLIASGELGLSHYLDCHVYLLHSDGKSALIDAGAGVQPERLIGSLEAPLDYLLLTLTHGDHAGGVAYSQHACLCYHVATPTGTLLFSGDTVFWGGLIQLLNTPGSEISDYRRGVQVLSGLGVDCLFPGHGLWALGNGQAHIDKMLYYFRRSA